MPHQDSYSLSSESNNNSAMPSDTVAAATNTCMCEFRGLIKG